MDFSDFCEPGPSWVTTSTLRRASDKPCPAAFSAVLGSAKRAHWLVCQLVIPI